MMQSQLSCQYHVDVGSNHVLTTYKECVIIQRMCHTKNVYKPATLS